MLLIIKEGTSYQLSCNPRNHRLQNIARVSSYTLLKRARVGCCLAVLQEITVYPPFAQVPISFTITPSYLCELFCNLAKHRLKRIAGARSFTFPEHHTTNCHLLFCRTPPPLPGPHIPHSITPSNLCQFSCDLANHRLK